MIQIVQSFNLPDWQLSNGYLYLTNRDIPIQPGQIEPNIGDIRVTYKSLDLRNSPVTFLGSINKDFANRNNMNRYSDSKSKYTLVDWSSPRNQKFVFFKTGSTSFSDIISEFKSSNIELLYMLRLVTLILMIVGFVSLGSIVNWILSWIPLCGDFIQSLWNFGAALVGLCFWLIVFVIAFFVARIDVAIAILVGIIGFVIGIQYYAKGKEKNKENGHTGAAGGGGGQVGGGSGINRMNQNINSNYVNGQNTFAPTAPSYEQVYGSDSQSSSRSQTEPGGYRGEGQTMQ